MIVACVIDTCPSTLYRHSSIVIHASIPCGSKASASEHRRQHHDAPPPRQLWVQISQNDNLLRPGPINGQSFGFFFAFKIFFAITSTQTTKHQNNHTKETPSAYPHITQPQRQSGYLSYSYIINVVPSHPFSSLVFPCETESAVLPTVFTRLWSSNLLLRSPITLMREILRIYTDGISLLCSLIASPLV